MSTIDTGFSSGVGTLENPIGIDEVVIQGKKKGVLANWADKLIQGVNSVTNLIISTKSPTSQPSTWETVVGDKIASVTEKSRTFSINPKSIALIVLGLGGLIYYYKKK